MRKRAGAATSVAEPVVAVAALLLIPLGAVAPAAAMIATAALLTLVWRALRAPA